MPSEWQWYEIVNSPTDLQQGDILEGIIVPELSRGMGEVVENEYNLIVMTQSCDIEDGIHHIVFCPVWTQNQMVESEPTFGNKSTIGNLLRGRVIGFHPINKYTLPGMERPWRIVQFQRILELDRSEVLNHVGAIGDRIRLLPPYREHLAQQFARFFMQVGLPIPIDMT
jgi:hypothetical protein